MRGLTRGGRVGLVVALSVSAVLGTATVVEADGPCGPGEVAVIGDDGSIICKKVRGGHDGGDRPGAGGGGTPVTLPAHKPLWTPFLSTYVLADGSTSRCIDSRMDYSLGRDPHQAEYDAMERRFFLYLRGGHPFCPDAEIPDWTSPALEAADLYRRIPLPAPTPYVHPGRLPVGFDAYLETGAPRQQTYGPEPTPFGDLYLEMAAQIYVDWDDPHDDVDGEEGPYAGSPGPHPDGEITHPYQYDGLYEITVRYVWTANWSLGADSGTLWGIETSGTYPAPGFEVLSRQAVG